MKRSPVEPFARLRRVPLQFVLSFAVATVACAQNASPGPSQVVLRAELRRIELVDRISPAVVCVLSSDQKGSGSGVLIDPRGYGLTNYHVVAGMLAERKGLGGLSDGELYDLEVLGVDPTGDVAMFRLLGREDFPFVTLGDSDAVRVGDTAIAMGNPFSISEDHTPTVTLGMVTGVHRYQWGKGHNLVYSDCIQVDTSINPGNSGGPLFNDAGEVIGINGRISISTRGRYNVGFAYAIASNQIARFVPALRAGLLARHGTLQAKVADIGDRGVVFTDLIRYATAHRAGVRLGDRLVAFDGTTIKSANHFVSMLGTYPEDWEVPLVIEREGRRLYTVATLEGVSPKMKRPYEVFGVANFREVERLFGALRSRYATSDAAPPSLTWQVSRQPIGAGKKRSFASDCFDASWMGGGPVYLEAVGASSSRAIQLDEHHAVRYMASQPEPIDLSVDRAGALRALYWTMVVMNRSLDDLDMSLVEHLGARAIIVDDADVPTGLERPSELGALGRRQLVEVLDWPIDEHFSVQFLIDPDTGRLVRVAAVTDDVDAVIEFGDFETVAGRTFPSRFSVRARSWAYQSTWSDWEALP